MSSFPYFGNALINLVFRNTAFTQPTTVYASLHSAKPTALNELAVTRQAITFFAPSDGDSSNSGDVTFTSAPSGTVTHIALWDASTGGNIICWGNIGAAQAVVNGDTVQIDTGDCILDAA